MSGRFLLDTNIVIAMLADERVVPDRPLNADGHFVSVTVVGELFYGACRSYRVSENIDRIEWLLGEAKLLVCDEATARLYGEIRTSLRKTGRPIPDNDIWIAATAVQHSLTLVTRDKHFLYIDDLSTVRW